MSKKVSKPTEEMVDAALEKFNWCIPDDRTREELRQAMSDAIQAAIDIMQKGGSNGL